MPTNIASAIGTQQQFTPQAARGYVGQYNGLRTERAFYQGTDTSLGDNMQKLSAALSNYGLAHEKYQEQTGMMAAERMVRMESQEDIEKLNTIDAAQQYGFLDDTANPYFRAYADKMRGGFLSAKMKREYDEKYAMEPTVSMDEEAKRYQEFQKEWKEKHAYELGTVINKTAFETGYNEAHPANISSLWNQWQEKRRDEDVVAGLQKVQSDLGAIAENLPVMLNQEGGMDQLKAQVQEAFNPVRLMGLPAKYRYGIMSEFVQKLMQTGRLNKEDMHELLDGVTFQTTLTGETVTLGQVLDRSALGDMADKWNAQFLDKETYDLVQDYIQRKDKDGWFAMVEAWRTVDPNKALALEKYTPAVMSGVDKLVEAERRAEEKAQKEALRRQQKKNEKKVKESFHELVYDAILKDKDYVTLPDGRTVPTHSAKIDKEQGVPFFTQKFLEHLNAGEKESAMKLLMSSNCKDIREEVASRFKADMAMLTSDKLSDPKYLGRMKKEMEFISEYANVVELYLGENIAKHGQVMASFANIYGDFDTGLSMYARYKDTDETTRSAYRDGISALIDTTVYDMDEVDNLEGGQSTISVYGNPDVKNDIMLMATALRCCGMDDENALNTAAAQFRDRYVSFRGAVIPKAVLTGIQGRCGDKPIYWLSAALNEYAGDYDTPRYNRREQKFYFGTNAPLRLSDLYNNAEIKYRQYMESVKNGGGEGVAWEYGAGEPNTQLTAEDVARMHEEEKAEEKETIRRELGAGATETDAEYAQDIMTSPDEERRELSDEEEASIEKGWRSIWGTVKELYNQTLTDDTEETSVYGLMHHRYHDRKK